MIRKLALTAAIVLITGCSTMTPARYAVSVDNNQVLKKLNNSKVKIVSMTPPESYSPNCRLMGPIKASDGKTIPQFVEKAFNDELKFADIYSESGVSLKGSLTQIEFSSTTGLTKGYWQFGMDLESSNGKSMSVNSRHDFESGFDAITACNQTAQALGSAVQDLINETITDPQFSELITP